MTIGVLPSAITGTTLVAVSSLFCLTLRIPRPSIWATIQGPTYPRLGCGARFFGVYSSLTETTVEADP